MRKMMSLWTATEWGRTGGGTGDGIAQGGKGGHLGAGRRYRSRGSAQGMPLMTSVHSLIIADLLECKQNHSFSKDWLPLPRVLLIISASPGGGG